MITWAKTWLKGSKPTNHLILQEKLRDFLSSIPLYTQNRNGERITQILKQEQHPSQSKTQHMPINTRTDFHKATRHRFNYVSRYHSVSTVVISSQSNPSIHPPSLAPSIHSFHPTPNTRRQTPLYLLCFALPCHPSALQVITSPRNVHVLVSLRIHNTSEGKVSEDHWISWMCAYRWSRAI